MVSQARPATDSATGSLARFYSQWDAATRRITANGAREKSRPADQKSATGAQERAVARPTSCQSKSGGVPFHPDLDNCRLEYSGLLAPGQRHERLPARRICEVARVDAGDRHR